VAVEIGATIVIVAALLTLFCTHQRKRREFGVFMRNQTGQSIVELTLLTPLLLAVLMVPVDFGLAIFAANLTQTAVREIARIAAATDPGSFNKITLKNALDARLPKNVTVTSSSVDRYTTGSANCMSVVNVSATVQYTYSWYNVIRLMKLSQPSSSLTISRTTNMSYQWQPYNTTNVACTAP
jgi:Flp pilus assembly protein TadG